MKKMDHKSLGEEDLKLLETFFLNSHDGIYIVGKSGEVLLANPAIIKMLGASYEEIMGVKLSTILEKGIYVGSPVLKAFETGQVFTGLVKARNGKEIMSTSKPVFNEKNELEMVITNCRLISVVEKFYRQYNINNTGKRVDLEAYTSRLEREFVYNSLPMKRMMQEVDTIAMTDSTMIIYGRTGSGKGLLAQYIHDKSPRRKGNLVEINCSAIPENLIESELFGYEKGAFTGASISGKLGLFEIAHEGTIFLDEIGEMPLQLQAKLLKVLDAGYVMRVGGTVQHKVNARIIVATNKNLRELVKQGAFREDLYYRLNVFPLTMPCLRDRKEDIKLLTEKILDELNLKYGANKRISSTTLQYFMEYDWPGNIRQLRNIVERIYVTSLSDEIFLASREMLHEDDEMYMECIVNEKASWTTKFEEGEKKESPTLKEYLSHLENLYIQNTLDKCGGSVSLAAKILGVHRTSLYKKIQIEKE